MKLSEARRDQYRRLAQKKGYVSRAAFKLEQLHRKYRLLKQGDVVIDLGCSPGGWLQVTSDIVGSQGLVVGVDLVEAKVCGKNIKILIDSVHSEQLPKSILDVVPRKADVILSDLSPKITGVWEVDQARQADLTKRALELATKLLRGGGSAVLKVFDGEMFLQVRESAENAFKVVRVAKPPASRASSSEVYLVCSGFRSQ